MGPLNVLFLCTGNSARSIMAEALMNQPSLGVGRFRGFSAGTFPDERIHPLTLETLEAHRIPTTGLRSKSWIEFYGPSAPPLNFVFTVCDQAASEPCPLWPGTPVAANWGVPDPVAAHGSEDGRRRAFHDAFLTLSRRVTLFASLPLEKLRGATLQAQLDEIGRR